MAHSTLSPSLSQFSFDAGQPSPLNSSLPAELFSYDGYFTPSVSDVGIADSDSGWMYGAIGHTSAIGASTSHLGAWPSFSSSFSPPIGGASSALGLQVGQDMSSEPNYPSDKRAATPVPNTPNYKKQTPRVAPVDRFLTGAIRSWDVPNPAYQVEHIFDSPPLGRSDPIELATPPPTTYLSPNEDEVKSGEFDYLVNPPEPTPSFDCDGFADLVKDEYPAAVPTPSQRLGALDHTDVLDSADPDALINEFWGGAHSSAGPAPFSSDDLEILQSIESIEASVPRYMGEPDPALPEPEPVEPEESVESVESSESVEPAEPAEPIVPEGAVITGWPLPLPRRTRTRKSALAASPAPARKAHVRRCSSPGLSKLRKHKGPSVMDMLPAVKRVQDKIRRDSGHSKRPSYEEMFGVKGKAAASAAAKALEEEMDLDSEVDSDSSEEPIANNSHFVRRTARRRASLPNVLGKSRAAPSTVVHVDSDLDAEGEKDEDSDDSASLRLVSESEDESDDEYTAPANVKRSLLLRPYPRNKKSTAAASKVSFSANASRRSGADDVGNYNDEDRPHKCQHDGCNKAFKRAHDRDRHLKTCSDRELHKKLSKKLEDDKAVAIEAVMRGVLGEADAEQHAEGYRRVRRAEK